jgi:hypothetical protein
MMKIGRHHLSGWRSWIDGAEASLRNENERTKTKKNKQNERTKERNPHKKKRMRSKQEKQKQPKAGAKSIKVHECLDTASCIF